MLVPKFNYRAMRRIKSQRELLDNIIGGSNIGRAMAE